MQKKAVISRVMAAKISYNSKIKEAGMFAFATQIINALVEQGRSQNRTLRKTKQRNERRRRDWRRMKIGRSVG
jgi:hypothetical protein